MKLRNQMLALACVLAFIGLGFLYFRAWVVQKPFAIILIVGDGLNSRTLAAARLFRDGASTKLTVQEMPNLAMLTNASLDYAVPDLAAASSAIATGEYVRNGNLSQTLTGSRLRTILDRARDKGRAVGLVTNGSLTRPGAAAFYGSGPVGSSFLDQLVHARLDVALGGGAGDFRGPDGEDLFPGVLENGFEIIRTRRQLENLGGFRDSPLLGVFADESLPRRPSAALDARVPSLPDMVRRAIEFLQYHRAGYLLVVDASLINELARKNDAEGVLRETLLLDDAIRTSIQYAGNDSLIIATGRLSTGGMAMNGYPLSQDHGVALLGTNAEGLPAIVWGTGPHGPDPSHRQPSDPAAYYLPAAVDVVDDMVAVGIGSGSETLRAYMHTTDIFDIIDRQL
jgi:alkaline phosphatase